MYTFHRNSIAKYTLFYSPILYFFIMFIIDYAIYITLINNNYINNFSEYQSQYLNIINYVLFPTVIALSLLSIFVGIKIQNSILQIDDSGIRIFKSKWKYKYYKFNEIEKIDIIKNRSKIKIIVIYLVTNYHVIGNYQNLDFFIDLLNEKKELQGKLFIK